MELLQKEKLSESPKTAVKTPGVNASVEQWQSFADGKDWSFVYEAWINWMIRGYEPYADHDKQVEELLRRRLLRIEQPVLSAKLIKRFSDRIITVADDAASSEVYAAVREQYAGRLCYVIEKSGRLRGFALSSVLVITGITPVNLFAKDIQSAAAKCNLRLTAEDDVPYIMSCRDELSAMMNEAGVPDFDGVFRWLLTGRAENGEFTVWYPYAGEFSRIGGNDSSRMLVKI